MNIKPSKRLSSILLLSISFFSCIVIILFTPALCIGQDKIYTETKQLNGKVTEITPDKVKFNNLDNPGGPVYSTARSKVKLLFNETGGFLVLRKLDSVDAKQAEKLIGNFINPPAAKPALFDRLITLQGKQYNCTIQNEDETSFTINYNDLDNTKYDKASVAVIIYKDGKHKLVADLAVAVEVLASVIAEKNPRPVAAKNEAAVKKTIPSNTNTVKPVPDESNNINEDGAIAAQANEMAPVKDNKEEKKQLALQKKAYMDSVNKANLNNEKYNKALINAASLYRKKDYANAKTAYLLASSFKPDEQEPKDKLDSINSKLSTSSEYDSLRDMADSLFSVDMDTSVAVYKKMLDINPGDHYAINQINFLEKEIAAKAAKKAQEEEDRRIQEAERIKKELNKRYQDALARAEAAAKEKKYEEALAAYNEALEINPKNDYARDRARIMANQANLLKKTPDNNKN